MRLIGEKGVGARARDDARVPGQQEAVDMHIGVSQEELHGRRHEFLRRQDAEVLQSLLLCREHRRRLSRRCRLKANAEEDDRPFGILPRGGKRVERRVDDADVRARRLRRGEARCAPGDFQHVAEGRDDDVLLPRVRDRRVDIGVVRHADGTAGT